MNIEDNLWYQNGYRIGDILIGFSRPLKRTTSIILEDYDYNVDSKALFTSDRKNYATADINGYWMSRLLRLKAQDYINDLDNPTDTEISLIQLQFPEIDINMMLEQIKELRS